MNCIFEMGDSRRSNIGLFYVLRNGLTVYMKLSRLCVISIHTMKENAEALLVAVVNVRGRGTLLYNWKF